MKRLQQFAKVVSAIVIIGCEASPPATEADAAAGSDAAIARDVDAGSSRVDASSPTDEGDASIDAPVPAELEWHRANLTNFESYPDPDSEECIEYNGCTWAGMFAALDGVQPEEWVMSHNIAAIHSRDFAQYRLKTLRLRQGDREIDVVVYDMCSDSDCSGCCTENAQQNGLDFLIDIEKYTMQRFGSGDGIVEWACLDC